MSAYLMAPEDLAAIAREAAKLSDRIDAERTFDLLLDENLKSVGYRYPDMQRVSDWCEDGEAAYTWSLVAVKDYSAEGLESVIRSYEYQSCEHPEWEQSAVYSLCQLLRMTLAPRVKAEKDQQTAKRIDRQAALAKLPSLNGKETAVIIRKLLKASYPVCKFSVRSDYNSVRVSWTDGPTTKQVDAIVQPFQAGHFDGMTDSYEYDRDSVVMIEGQAFVPRCQYVFTERRTSPTLARRAAQQIAAYYGVQAPEVVDKGSFWMIPADTCLSQANEYWSTLIHQATSDASRFARHD
jgi:hypothetical protein